MLTITGWVWIITRGDGVFAANATINTFCSKFATTLVMKHSPSCLLGIALGGVDTRCST